MLRRAAVLGLLGLIQPLEPSILFKLPCHFLFSPFNQYNIMENEKVNGGDSGVDGGDKSSITTVTTELGEEQNPNSTTTTTAGEILAAEPITRQSSRTPFTNLSQVDADLALARTLQEQERAFMMLSGNNVGSDYGSWETGSFNDDDLDGHNDGDHDDDDVDGDEDEDGEDEDDDDENEYDDEDEDDEVEGDGDDEDAFDVHAHEDIEVDNILSIEIDPSVYPDDEAYARALQDAEDRELASRLRALAGLNNRQVENVDDNDNDDDGDDDSQDTWEDVDPDELSYEELIALGDVVGTQSRGLSSATIESLQSVKYKLQENHDGNNDTCVICRLDYEDDDTLTVLSCKHSYHSECINNWLQINKACPVCKAEVSAASEIK